MRSPLRWLLLAALSLGGAWYAWRTFPRAFSLVSLDLRMDRAAALAAADSLARRYGWAPDQGARQAARFTGDEEAQTFIELEGGGTEAFLGLIADGRFAPWTWEVRRFRPGDVGETRVRFTPEGRPWGFAETVPEDAPGATLEPEAARVIAERTAAVWAVPLDRFAPVETAREARPSGRVDHTFVYERRDAELGEGRLRLRLVVTGDRTTELRHLVQVPEAFTRRYAHMRSANEGLTLGSMGLALLLYGGLGIGVGLFIMLRRGRVLWRAPLAAGLVLGILQGGALVNALPLAWLEYDTAQSVETFRLMQAALVVLGVLFTALQVALSAAAAESLTRAAFPHHPQLWRLWSREAGASSAILSRTVLGYLLVGLLLAWAVGFSLASRDWQGWWSPTDLLLQPNQLATALPWLGPIALSAHAGFWEECLFRAVPLAGAALLGQRYGHRALWLGGAFVLQALVFAAAHAAYPAQPAYARVVELMLPSFLFGGAYLRWGFLPAVILHFGYDLALTSIPLFVAETPGILTSRVLVVGGGLLPLGIVLWRRAQAGRWLELPAALRNAGWEPAPAAPRAQPPEPEAALTATPSRWLLPAGGAGLVLWLASAGWSSPVPPLTLRRGEAVAAARAALEARGVELDRSWRVLPSVSGGGGLESRFVWETAGDSTWHALLGDALPVPAWRVRFARFEGDVSEGADQWLVAIGTDGRRRVEHRLPEARPGVALGEADALRLADSIIAAESVADPARLRLVSVEPRARPARTDWEVTFTDTATRLPEGEVRVRVSLAGDAGTELARFVHVPEAWERAWRRARSLLLVVPAGTVVLFGLLWLGLVIAGVVRWARTGIDVRVARLTTLVMLPVGLLGWYNAWPGAAAQFATTQPWGMQVILFLAGGILAVGVVVAGSAIVMASALPPPGAGKALPAALGLGALLGGTERVLESLAAGPPGSQADGLDTLFPVLAGVDDVAFGFLVRLVLVLLVLGIGARFRGRAGYRTAWYLVAGCLGTLAAAGADGQGLALAWAAGAAVLVVVARSGPALGGSGVMAAALTWALFAVVPEGRLDDPSRWLSLGLGAVVTLLLVRGLRPRRAMAS